MLFGEKFQSKLTSTVEKETALAKAVSVTNCHKGKEDYSRKVGQRGNKVFSTEPCYQVRGWTGQKICTVPPATEVPGEKRVQARKAVPQTRTETTVPRTPTPTKSNQQPNFPQQGSQSYAEEILETLRVLPPSRLGEVGI